jgi:argininosuccinate lyase
MSGKKKSSQVPAQQTGATLLWAGRLAEKPEIEAFTFQSSIQVDKRLAPDDIAGSRAHAAMLGAQNIIPPETAAAIIKELDRIEKDLRTGKLAIDENAEDIHSFIEGVLTSRIGDAGRMVHAGRSRNDQVALDFRLYLKRTIPELRAALRETITVLLDRAGEHAIDIMPGYTHLQRAQPVTLGHHLLAWCAALERDRSRFADALARLDECPLGSGALAGSSLPIDRKATACALGFARPSWNTMDAVASRDFACEVSAACAITMTNLSRFCEDIVLWASEEFGYINLAESWSTGSSIMPQKKNPDFAELIRGKAGRTTGNLVTLLTMLKGLPYAYNKDMQEDKESLFDSIDTMRTCLRMFGGMMRSAKFNTLKMAAACIGGFLDATDAAEYLVRKGLPFRKAHTVAARLVRDCLLTGHKSIAGMSLEKLRAHSSLFDESVYQELRPKVSVQARNMPGGPAIKEVRRQVRLFRKRLERSAD